MKAKEMLPRVRPGPATGVAPRLCELPRQAFTRRSVSSESLVRSVPLSLATIQNGAEAQLKLFCIFDIAPSYTTA
jgi:hypothetical protein